MPLPSLLDEEYLTLSRAHITAMLHRILPQAVESDFRILEIGPKLAWPAFDTLDIDPAARPTICADICGEIPITDAYYDLVLCVSVLEHTYFPDQALANIRRILKPSGMVALQAPLNFRQHGPQPDLWRFTENGWRFLLRDWVDVEIDILDAPERPLFPIAYAITARPGLRLHGVDLVYDIPEFTPKWIDR